MQIRCTAVPGPKQAYDRTPSEYNDAATEVQVAVLVSHYKILKTATLSGAGMTKRAPTL